MEQVWRPLTEAETLAGRTTDTRPFGAFSPRPAAAALIWLTRRSILRRGVFRDTIANLAMRLNGGRMDLHFRGAGYRLEGDANLIETGLMLVPEYNATEIDFLLADAPQGACFVDIGSNVGLYALPLAAALPAGRVVAIDANPRMVAHLSWNALASALGNVTAIHAAVSGSETRADLVIRKGDIAIVAVRENPSGAMPVRPLAALLRDAGITRVHALKIDIEGHEDKALVPYLSSTPPENLPRRIVIETTPQGDHPGCAAAFARLGYRRVHRTKNNSCFLLNN